MKQSLAAIALLTILTSAACAQETLGSAIEGLDPGEFGNYVFAWKNSNLLEFGNKPLADFSIVAPTDAAWNKLPSNFKVDILKSGNSNLLNKFVGCHIVTDPVWSAAISSIEREQGGSYSAMTLGGCSLAASWSDGAVKVQTDLGDGSTFFTENGQFDVGSVRLGSVETIFLPSGTALDGVIRASRVFSGPTQFPPRDYAAYGMLIFLPPADEAAKVRQSWICETYVKNLTHTSLVAVKPGEQMVTVWPVRTNTSASDLNRQAPEKLCDDAIAQYDFLSAQVRLENAKAAGVSMGDRGPLLVAWSPPSTIGGAEAVVLTLDMSNVTTAANAQNAFRFWIERIEQRPDLWRKGFDVDKVRLELQFFVDRTGEAVAQLWTGPK